MATDLDDLAIETGRHVRRLAAIDEAGDGAQVVRIVREYLAGLGRVELMGLPEDCWPGRVADAADVVLYASRLATRRVLAGECLAGRLLVQRLNELLAHAAAQLASRALSEISDRARSPQRVE